MADKHFPDVDELRAERARREQEAHACAHAALLKRDAAWSELVSASLEFLQKAEALNVLPESSFVRFRHKRTHSLGGLWRLDEPVYSTGPTVKGLLIGPDIAIAFDGDLWTRTVTGWTNFDGDRYPETWDWAPYRSAKPPQTFNPPIQAILDQYDKVLRQT